MSEELTYQSFLLRLWRAHQNGDITWRASLEYTSTGKKQSFSSLEAMFEFLHNLDDVVENEVGTQKQD